MAARQRSAPNGIAVGLNPQDTAHDEYPFTPYGSAQPPHDGQRRYRHGPGRPQRHGAPDQNRRHARGQPGSRSFPRGTISGNRLMHARGIMNERRSIDDRIDERGSPSGCSGRCGARRLHARTRADDPKDRRATVCGVSRTMSFSRPRSLCTRSHARPVMFQNEGSGDYGSDAVAFRAETAHARHTH